MSSVVDPLGRTTEYTYDSGRDLVSVKNPGGGTWSFTYGPGHLMLTMTDPDGGTVTNAYDGGGRVTSQTDPMGRTTTFAYSGDNFSNAGGTTTITDQRDNRNPALCRRFAHVAHRGCRHRFGSHLELHLRSSDPRAAVCHGSQREDVPLHI